VGAAQPPWVGPCGPVPVQRVARVGEVVGEDSLHLRADEQHSVPGELVVARNIHDVQLLEQVVPELVVRGRAAVGHPLVHHLQRAEPVRDVVQSADDVVRLLAVQPRLRRPLCVRRVVGQEGAEERDRFAGRHPTRESGCRERGRVPVLPRVEVLDRGPEGVQPRAGARGPRHHQLPHDAHPLLQVGGVLELAEDEFQNLIAGREGVDGPRNLHQVVPAAWGDRGGFSGSGRHPRRAVAAAKQ